MTNAIIVAAGKSERMGTGTDKAFLSLGNRPVVAWSLIAFEKCPDIDRIILVVRKEQQLAAKAVAKMFGISKLVAVVPGGNKRQESVQAGLAVCDVDTRFVVVHDGARPCVTPEVISEVVKLAKPQAFNFRVLQNAYKSLGKNDVTDDCQAVELSGEAVRIYENREPNFKITTVEDLQIASALLVK